MEIKQKFETDPVKNAVKNPEEEMNALRETGKSGTAPLSDDALDNVAGGVDMEFLK